MAAGEDREIAAVRSLDIGEKIERLHRQRLAGFGHANPPERLPSVGVGKAGKFRCGSTNNGLRHAEHDVGAHELKNQVENVWPIHEVPERLGVAKEVPAVHEGVGVVRGRIVLHPAVMAERQTR